MSMRNLEFFVGVLLVLAIGAELSAKASYVIEDKMRIVDRDGKNLAARPVGTVEGTKTMSFAEFGTAYPDLAKLLPKQTVAYVRTYDRQDCEAHWSQEGLVCFSRNSVNVVPLDMYEQPMEGFDEEGGPTIDKTSVEYLGSDGRTKFRTEGLTERIEDWRFSFYGDAAAVFDGRKTILYWMGQKALVTDDQPLMILFTKDGSQAALFRSTGEALTCEALDLRTGLSRKIKLGAKFSLSDLNGDMAFLDDDLDGLKVFEPLPGTYRSLHF